MKPRLEMEDILLPHGQRHQSIFLNHGNRYRPDSGCHNNFNLAQKGKMRHTAFSFSFFFSSQLILVTVLKND